MLLGPASRVFGTQLVWPQQLFCRKALRAGLKRGGNKAGLALHKSMPLSLSSIQFHS
ncbi:hypothetical protein CROQUDRAFT_102710 [Cronartium quercuum f. sp. fusiforme G11]|uniref:Uncharacterized protein n=1 Tax=Cronartium quercuum f. sp. fusiforme G11 TaxID=708437 RepID=A0A9P6N570_9BASI|nr:hypothetical protein CROQUDRAFT_102710 [Cronartium quercuum f. sp. fusiforme G11]